MTAPAQVSVPGTEQFKNVATGYVIDSNANKQVYTRASNYQKWS